MKKILITAYAVNPYKGSEDGIAWNMIVQAARFSQVTAVTRKNNRPAIEQYINAHPQMDDLFARLSFLYFDWPQWALTWKKGPMLSMVYYYGWQLSLAVWLTKKKLDVDLVHNLNFQNDWTPTFLWLLKKPMVWGHVGHHPKIPRNYILPIYGKKEYYKDRALWLLKNMFWNFDPFLYICKRKAAMVICMNAEAVKMLRLKNNYIVHPSVASEKVVMGYQQNSKTKSFQVLSVGRLVPLKGFDLTIRSFAQFYKTLSENMQTGVKLSVVGSGPSKNFLKELVVAQGIQEAVEFIEWIPREEVKGIYQSASVFLFPSHEGAGMVVPEAMSYSLPVVCLKNCGPGEMLHPNSQLAVPYGIYKQTVAMLAGNLSKLFWDKNYMLTEKALAQERYETLFRWDVKGEMLEEVYKNAILK